MWILTLFIFQKQYSSKTQTESLINKVKGFDSSSITPRFQSLKEKILRTMYVTSMWKNATDPKCALISPEVWGMKTKLESFWFYFNPTPLMVDDIVTETTSKMSNDSSDEDDSDDKVYTSDSDIA